MLLTALSIATAIPSPTPIYTTRTVKFAWNGTAYELDWGSNTGDAIYNQYGTLAGWVLRNKVAITTTGPISVKLPSDKCYIVAVGAGGVSNVLTVPAKI